MMPTHKQLVDAAITDGRISAHSRGAFINALATDPEGTKRVLAAMAPLPAHLRPGKRVTASAATTSAAPRVTGTHGNLERIEVGREPTQEEKLEEMHWQMTFGADGKRAPEHIVYYRDTSGPRIIDHGDGTGHWALPGE